MKWPAVSARRDAIADAIKRAEYRPPRTTFPEPVRCGCCRAKFSPLRRGTRYCTTRCAANDGYARRK